MCEQEGGYIQQEIVKYDKSFNHAETLNMSTKDITLHDTDYL